MGTQVLNTDPHGPANTLNGTSYGKSINLELARASQISLAQKFFKIGTIWNWYTQFRPPRPYKRVKWNVRDVVRP